MKSIVLLSMIGVAVIPATGISQYGNYAMASPRGELINGYPEEFWKWWEKVWADYMADYRTWEIGYIQDWNENMQAGIKRLNTQPFTNGVTPLNGALLLNHSDVSVPGRLGNYLSVSRYYNSKIWYRDTTCDSLDYAWHLGLGWQMHFGRLWPTTDSARIYESSSGLRTFFRQKPNGEYISTDGTFMKIDGNTIRTGDGTKLIFNQLNDWNQTYSRYLTKIVDRNGNVTDLFYNDGILDSIITSTNERVIFHYSEHDNYQHNYLLDSITYTAFNNQTACVAYHYDTFVASDSSPFGPYPDTTFLLESVVYPNSESVYFDYNQYFELVAVHNSGGGLTRFEYKTDTFYIPVAPAYPPDDSCDFKQQLTRGISKVKNYDPWTAPDTSVTEYVRIFTDDAANRAISNADSVVIIFPEGNYQVFEHYASYAPVTEVEAVKFIWDNGKLKYRYFYDNCDSLLKRHYNGAKCITSDSIPMPSHSYIYSGTKKYFTEYCSYDDYGNPTSIAVYGDTSIDTDDFMIQREYWNNNITSWLKLTYYEGHQSLNVKVSHTSLQGIDSIAIRRSWDESDPDLNPDSTIWDTIRYSPACFEGDTTVPLTPYPGTDTLAIIEAWAWYAEESLKVWSDIINLAPDTPQVNTENRYNFDGSNEYLDKYIVRLLEKECIKNLAGTTTLAKTGYYYDGSHIVRNYLSSQAAQWDTSAITPCTNIRGNLARIDRWNGDGSETTEFRYDEVGNAVMAISHPDYNRAETTFTYYDPPSNPDTFSYAYPWRVVNHLSTSVCSLSSRTEYDLHTGLPIRTFDFNGDSTVFIYDNMNRLTHVFLANETDTSQKITYLDNTNPEAIINSVRLDSRWLVKKSFYDGFGRLIQTKSFDFDNNRTVTQSVSYNCNGLPDTSSTPYTISGTSTNYSAPTWSSLDIAQYEYEGLNRITKIIYPDAESIRIKYYANADTIFDEEGNKTVRVYTSFGEIDTLIDALNDTTIYEYDRLGRLTKVKDAECKETQYYYDKLGRLIAMNGPDAKSSYTWGGDSVDVVYEYDDIGNLTLKKNASGWTDYAYDDINRLVKVRHSPNQGQTWFIKDTLTYDTHYSETGYPNNSLGRLSRIVKVGVDSLTLYYDDKGRLDVKCVGIVGLSETKEVHYDYNKADLCTLLTLQPGASSVRYNYNTLGKIKEIANLVNNFKYNSAGQVTRISHPGYVADTIVYNNRLRPTYIKAYNSGPAGDNYLKIAYTYEKNGNVASIVDSLDNTRTLSFKYDAQNRLDTVLAYDNSVAQRFTYDKAGNRLSMNGTAYTYWQNTNRLKNDHRGYTFDYDDLGNVVRHRATEGGATIDSFTYDWNGCMVEYNKGNERIDLAYNSSRLRVKKYYHSVEEPGDGGESGSYFIDGLEDMGILSTGTDTIYNKGRDIDKIFVKDSANYLTLVVANRHLFSGNSHQKLFITLDIDTIPNSGRLTLPEDSLTKVKPECAWEYCIYVDDNGYGVYRQDGSKISMPFGMLMQRVTGDTGRIKVKVSKSLINTPEVIRYTISTFNPDVSSNPYTLWQGGSTACDVFPGTKETFGGEINGYGEITSSLLSAVKEYTIYYVYDGINPIAEYSPNGSILARYVYAGGLHIAKIAGADTNWYHCDALGSPRVMTNELGAVTWTATYFPFGEMTAGSNNTHGFTGKEYDIEMGLNYFCQRYYDPEIGRFMTPDPFWGYTSSPQTLNRYSYCMNNPLAYIDPFGLEGRPLVYPRDIQNVFKGYLRNIQEYIGLPTVSEAYNNREGILASGERAYGVFRETSAPGIPGMAIATGRYLILFPTPWTQAVGYTLIAYGCLHTIRGVIESPIWQMPGTKPPPKPGEFEMPPEPKEDKKPRRFGPQSSSRYNKFLTPLPIDPDYGAMGPPIWYHLYTWPEGDYPVRKRSEVTMGPLPPEY